MNSWTLRFDMEKNPLPLNGSRGQTAAARRWRSRWTAAIRNRTITAATDAGIPLLGTCQARLTWYVRTAHRRDVDNLALLEKAMFDGLVRAGVVPDDTPDLMTKHRAEIVQVDPKEHAEAWFELWVAPRPTIDDIRALAADLGLELQPWQQRIAEQLLAGGTLTIPSPAAQHAKSKRDFERMLRTIASITEGTHP
ncbi:hypothetical protein [Agromyces sp. SYSU T00194]|uniref:hypothetical protein n=1 Tax=Agromyces chitinivorans TaxID=3158560 RepID=UPI003398340B